MSAKNYENRLTKSSLFYWNACSTDDLCKYSIQRIITNGPILRQTSWLPVTIWTQVNVAFWPFFSFYRIGWNSENRVKKTTKDRRIMMFNLEQNALETSAVALDQFRVGCILFYFLDLWTNIICVFSGAGATGHEGARAFPFRELVVHGGHRRGPKVNGNKVKPVSQISHV